MLSTPHPTYTVFKGNKAGQLVELDIPVDAVRFQGESHAAFHERAAIAQRISIPGTRIRSCRCS